MINDIHSLKLTWPLKMVLPKRKRSYSNHPFSRAMLISWSVYNYKYFGTHSKVKWTTCLWCGFPQDVSTTDDAPILVSEGTYEDRWSRIAIAGGVIYLGIGLTSTNQKYKNNPKTELLRSTPFQDLAKMADEVDRHRLKRLGKPLV